MAYRLDDTIAALATARGGAGRGIVRVSGQQAFDCVESIRISPPEGEPLRSLSRAGCRSGELQLGDLAARLPCELFCWPGQRSFTREPVVEIHTLGSPPLLDALLQALCRQGARLAEPGEFTLRAFLAGRLDLTQAEAVLGVIEARNEHQLDTALVQLAGGMSGPLHQLREILLDTLADLEAGLDFTEEDIEFISSNELQTRFDAALATMDQLIARLRSRNAGQEMPRVVLIGWPNVGKSSLFNALVGQPAALVSNQQGTTRDYLTAPLDCDAVTCQLIDTAGVEPIERQENLAGVAQRLAGAQQAAADIQLFCVDASRPLNSWERGELARMPLAIFDRLIVVTKADQPFNGQTLPGIHTSSLTGLGLDRLRAEIARTVEARTSDGGAVAGTAARCSSRLNHARDALGRARQLVAEGAGDELVALDLRQALDAIGEVVGTIYTDDVLGRIFSRFCIGK